MPLEHYPDVLTVEELCEVLNIEANAAYQLLKEQTVPAFRLAAGGRFRKKRLSITWLVEKLI